MLVIFAPLAIGRPKSGVTPLQKAEFATPSALSEVISPTLLEDVSVEELSGVLTVSYFESVVELDFVLP